MPTLDNLAIGLTGSPNPDNFTIEIYEWNVTAATAQLRQTYATNVSRTTPSPSNGGTLATNNYAVSGIQGTDYYLKLTANNQCTSNAILSLRETDRALTVYSVPPVVPTYGTQGTSYGTSFSGGVTQSTLVNNLGYIDTLFYLGDDAPVYPLVGNATTFTTSFTFQHVSTQLFGGGSVPVQWQNGLFDISTMTFEQDPLSPFARHYIKANQTAGIAQDGTNTYYYSSYRITYNVSNSSRIFTVYYAGSPV